jgi:hypothetical protein
MAQLGYTEDGQTSENSGQNSGRNSGQIFGQNSGQNSEYAYLLMWLSIFGGAVRLRVDSALWA